MFEKVAAAEDSVDFLFSGVLKNSCQRRSKSLPSLAGYVRRRPFEGGIKMQIGEMSNLQDVLPHVGWAKANSKAVRKLALGRSVSTKLMG